MKGSQTGKVTEMVKLIECPRDAMQGLDQYIPASEKARYINQLLKVNFDTIDFGSFVSPKAVPQMRDTAEVLNHLDLSSTRSRLLAIIANKRGAEDAASFDEIYYLGFPLSLSETFQRRNTNKSIEEAFQVVDESQDICTNKKKELVVYLSMGFGNPYGDSYNEDYLAEFSSKLVERGVKIISLADTVGVATPEIISKAFDVLGTSFPDVEFGAHFHSKPGEEKVKIEKAFESGCRRFDSAIKGFGGCPMAKDDLVGNLATEEVVSFFQEKSVILNLDLNELLEANRIASEIFPAK